jgi:hypothetical protein
MSNKWSSLRALRARLHKNAMHFVRNLPTALGRKSRMNTPNPEDFTVRPEVSALYETSFILGGMFFCERCQASPPEQTEATAYSNHHYYLVAELAYDLGWRPDEGAEDAVLCSNCAASAERAMAADRAKPRSG